MKSKKLLITLFKDFSKVYGRLDIRYKIKGGESKILTLNFFNKNTVVDKVNYNLNKKKILESKEKFNTELKELIINLVNTFTLNLLNEEMERTKVFSKIGGLFSIFKGEIEQMPVKLNTRIHFFSKLFEKNYSKNLMSPKIHNNETLSNFLPSIANRINFQNFFTVYFFGSLKIFPTTNYSRNSFRIFRNLSRFKILIGATCPIKWVYPRGLIFKCSMVYFLILSDFCKKTTKKKISNALKFFFFQNIFLKSIVIPIQSSLSCHLIFNRLKKNLISETLNCFKFRLLSQEQLNYQKYPFLLTRSCFSRINNWLIRCFWNFITKRFYMTIFKKNKCVYRKFFPSFYIPLKKKIMSSNINFIKFKLPLKTREREGNTFLKKCKNLKFYKKKNQWLVSKKFIHFLKSNLLSFKILKKEKIRILVKLEKKRLNFELAIETTKNYIGFVLKIVLVYTGSLKFNFSFRIISNWHLFKILVSNKKFGDTPYGLEFYSLLKIENKKINMEFSTNYFQKLPDYSLKEKILVISLNKLKFLKKNFDKGTPLNYNLIFKLGRMLSVLYTENNIRNLKLKLFSIFKQIQIPKLYYKRSVLISLITLLINWIKKYISVVKIRGKLNPRLFNKGNDKKLNFFQKINIEYYMIMTYYIKK